MSDRRKESRSPTFLGGLVAMSTHAGTAECVIRNRSEHGARLKIDIGTHLPDSFDLTIPQQRTAMRVQARWRQRDAMGVEIVGAPSSQALVPEFGGERLRRLKAENEQLKRRVREIEGD